MDYAKFLVRIVFISLLLLLGTKADAQVRPGVKFGISTPDVHPKDIIIKDDQGTEFYRIVVKDAKYGIHVGAFLQIQFGGFFAQPEILYNSTRVEYRIDSIPSMSQDVFTDTYRSVDFPLMVGLKSGPVRIGGGPVGHMYLDSDSGFSKYEGFNAFIEDLTWGWQAGVGLDVWKLHVDLRYEGNFSKLGDQITFFGKEFDFATNNNKMIASLGFSF